MLLLRNLVYNSQADIQAVQRWSGDGLLPAVRGALQRCSSSSSSLLGHQPMVRRPASAQRTVRACLWPLCVCSWRFAGTPACRCHAVSLPPAPPVLPRPASLSFAPPVPIIRSANCAAAAATAAAAACSSSSTRCTWWSTWRAAPPSTRRRSCSQGGHTRSCSS